ncbi:IS701 family transposase [Actinoplanes siamensis]|nr:transposase [Actinoplanes siamensis]
MRDGEIGALWQQTFLEGVFQPLPRADQRHWARTYLRGLLSAPHGATPRQLAAAQSLPAAAAHRLHQFVNVSSWAWEPVRQALARQICAHTMPAAWTVTELFLPRQGPSVVGVHDTVDTGTGRPVSGQRAFGLFLSTERDSFPVSWRLLLGDAWVKDRQRRQRARIPKDVTARARWAYLMEFVGEVTQGQLPNLPWIFAVPLAPPDVSGVLAALAHCRLDVVCEVTPEQEVTPERQTRSGGGSAAAVPVGDLLSRRPARTGSGSVPPARRTPPVSATVRLGGPRQADAESRTYQAMEWAGQDGRGPVRYVLTTLTPRRAARALAGAAEDTRAAAAAMSRCFGARDFLGRSFPGWHHHMTMASAAYAYRRLTTAPPEATAACS